MANKQIKMSRIDVNHKFQNYDEAYNHAHKLKASIEYLCRTKNYKCEAIIGVSNLSGKIVNNFFYDKTGSVGRPKIKRDVVTSDDEIIKRMGKLGANGELGKVYIGYHLHILILGYPGETIRKSIKSYINKNWWTIPKLYEKNSTLSDEKKVYGKDCNIGYADYIFRQSENVLFIDCNFSDYSEVMSEDYSSKVKDFNSERFNCSLKHLYYECLRLNTLFKNNNLSYQEKEEQKEYYYEMLKYYNTFTKQYDDKKPWLKDYINKQLS